MDCRFEVRRSADTYSVVLHIAGQPPIESELDLDKFTLGPHSETIRQLRGPGCPTLKLTELGSQLWNALRPEAIRKVIDESVSLDSIVLDVPPDPELDLIPWEAIHDETRGGFLCTILDLSLTRSLPPARTAKEERAEQQRPLSILVVIPQGSELDSATEYAKLERIVSRLGSERCTISRIDGIVTTDRIVDVLGSAQFDIFHFIGHSQFSASTGVLVRINDPGNRDCEAWIGAAQFAKSLAGANIRLAIMNSCESAQSASYLVPGVGQQLARVARIPAVVAMQYRAEDPSAVSFAEAFYRSLLHPQRAGRVDLAIQSGRDKLYRDARPDALRAFVNPVLYLTPGHGQLFPAERIVPLGAPGAVKTPARQAGEGQIPQAARIAEMLLAGQCVPVVGPGACGTLLRDTAIDQVSPRQNLLQLVMSLAAAAKYPDAEELRAAEKLTDFAGVVLPRIFQHYELQQQHRYNLIELLQQKCAAKPSELLTQIASWPAPAFVYMHFDGLMKAALDATGRACSQINMPHKPLAATADMTIAARKALTILFNVRGSIDDPESVILTDRDHELLHDRLANASTDIANLFGTHGRSFLFIGVSPLDPAARRLARLYFGELSLVRYRYFVLPHLSAADEAYWSTYKVDWIERDPRVVVDAINAEIARRRN